MATKGKLVLINGTNFDWRRKQCYSFQMHSYKFPEMIINGTCEICEIQWDENAFITTWTNEGNVTYELIGSNYSFSIDARIHSGFDIYVSYMNLSNLGHNFIKLDWVNQGHGFMQFYLCGRENHFVSTGSFAGANCWMYENLDLLGNKKLNQLCIAGSHDSGMSEINWRSTFANPKNCKTQSYNIYQQLMCGIRYFDLRVVIGSGQYHSGHYALIGGIEYLGARGQPLKTIIDQINNFTACNNELIILSLSHCLNLDLGLHSRPFNEQELRNLCHKMMDINHRFICPSRDAINLTEKLLSDFIGHKSSAVLIILNDDSSLEIDRTVYYHKGFFTRKELTVIDEYSNTNDLDVMIIDQMTKLSENRSKSHKNYFLLSFTLTQQNIQTFGAMFGPSILEMAELANSNLFKILSSSNFNQATSSFNFRQLVSKGLPNVILLDYIDTNVTALCLAINLFNHTKRPLFFRILEKEKRLRALCCLLSRIYLLLSLFIFNCLVYLCFHQ